MLELFKLTLFLVTTSCFPCRLFSVTCKYNSKISNFISVSARVFFMVMLLFPQDSSVCCLRLVRIVTEVFDLSYVLLLQAIAIVLGFLVCVGLIILLVFAVKTRRQMLYWGPERILWDDVKLVNSVAKNSVGEWVSLCHMLINFSLLLLCHHTLYFEHSSVVLRTDGF